MLTLFIQTPGGGEIPLVAQATDAGGNLRSFVPKEVADITLALAARYGSHAVTTTSRIEADE